jgi:purine-nucleoside phosphorylase
VSGHAGKLIVGSTGGQEIVVMQGRVHYYEGYSMKEVTFPVRVLARLGIKTLLLTNAAGTVNEGFKPGDVMLISDHLNLTGDNPLMGHNDDRLGVRFPDMSEIYDREIGKTMHKVATDTGFALCEGVYAGLSGPSYETPAEIRMLRVLGADAVGMSTVAEAIVAKHGGLRVFGLSVITNYAAGMSSTPLDHQEVKDTGEMVRERLTAFLKTLIGELA